MKVCRECDLEITPDNRMKSGADPKTGLQRYRLVCKHCHSARVMHDQKEKLMEKSPWRYWQCGDCCLIVNKRFKSDGSCKRCGKFNLKDGDGYLFSQGGKQDEKLRVLFKAAAVTFH